MVKKLINDPDAVVDEMVEGILGAHPDLLRRSEASPRVLLSAAAAAPGKVGIVTGGGSGHEPAFWGYVGAGLADAAAVGNVFASPSPEPILAATRAVEDGRGVLYLYGNYAGDVMNFDMAGEFAAAENIEVASLAVTDDVASAPREQADERRGVAGDVFVLKAAGAAADRGDDLAGVLAAARKANERTLTMGVALTPCALPQTLKPNFELPEGEMEIGLGVHGEPGVLRGPLRPADAVADELMDRILAELPASRGDRVAVLVNGLGATPLMEQYVILRRVRQRLDDAGLGVHRTLVGNYITSLEMAGCSVSVMALDGELAGFVDHPVRSVALRNG